MKKSHLTGKRFNLATLGDVHLGHPRTSTKKIVDVILEAFPGNRETADLDMISMVMVILLTHVFSFRRHQIF